MMKYTEEEKKAVENIKEILSFNLRNPFLDDEADNIEILLNLLEKQQKEIEELTYNNEILKKLPNSKEKYIDVLENKLFNSVSKEEIRKKIKEIDENGYWDFLEERDCEKIINILKELLGDE